MQIEGTVPTTSHGSPPCQLLLWHTCSDDMLYCSDDVLYCSDKVLPSPLPQQASAARRATTTDPGSTPPGTANSKWGPFSSPSSAALSGGKSAAITASARRATDHLERILSSGGAEDGAAAVLTVSHPHL